MAYGTGSMLVALWLPRVLDAASDRKVMLPGAVVLAGALAAAASMPGHVPALGLWFVLGAGASLILTPGGRLLARSSAEADRPALYAAHFSLSHACWLLTCPLAGWLGMVAGLTATFVVMAMLAVLAGLTAMRLWPVRAQ